MKNHLTFAFALLTLICTSAHAQLPSYLPADGLVGWWPFNGNANDESGNGNDGVVNGAVLAGDINNIESQAYYFDGINDYISIVNLTTINGDNSRSFVAWVKLNTGQNGGVIISQGAELFQSGCNQGFHFNATGTAADCGYSGCGVITNCSQVRHPYTLNDGVWHQVVVTYSNGGYGGLKFYADGQLISVDPNNCAQGDQFSSFNTGSLFGVNFGKRNDEFYSNCFLDDIAIYNRALTEQEIQNLYTGSDTGTTTDSGDGAAPLPQGIPYQAAARDANGQPVVDSPVNVRFSLREGAVDGATSYIESHSLTTNSIGLFNTVFGNGTPVQSAFDSINWAATTKFLQVEVDLGNGYVDMGTTQLLSVPYAFRSAQAANIKNAALPIYPDNTAALAGGLLAGEMYRTATGDLKVVY